MKLERRIVHAPDLTPEQIREICEVCQREGLPKDGLGKSIKPPFSDKLTGLQFTMRFGDFRDLTYRFNGPEELAWSEDGETFKEEYCQITELPENSNLFFVHHLRAYTFPLEAYIFVIDMNSELVTLVHSTLGDFIRPREVDRTFHFGYIVREGKEAPSELHDFTKDFDGKIIDWHYDQKGDFIVRHFYIDHLHKIDRLIVNGAFTFNAAVTCDYVKIRDDAYIMTWIETYGQGVQGCALIDMNTLFDVGSFFGINYQNTLDSHTFAGQGVYSDTL